MKRTDLPTPIRRDLDAQRRMFVRQVGQGFEDLIERGVDPSLWMASVLQSLEAVKDAAEEPVRKAA